MSDLIEIILTWARNHPEIKFDTTFVESLQSWEGDFTVRQQQALQNIFERWVLRIPTTKYFCTVCKKSLQGVMHTEWGKKGMDYECWLKREQYLDDLAFDTDLADKVRAKLMTRAEADALMRLPTIGRKETEPEPSSSTGCKAILRSGEWKGSECGSRPVSTNPDRCVRHTVHHSNSRNENMCVKVGLKWVKVRNPAFVPERS